MAAVEIHLGRRTVLEYLLSSVTKAVQEAGREKLCKILQAFIKSATIKTGAACAVFHWAAGLKDW
jgi:hypothetical protein